MPNNNNLFAEAFHARHAEINEEMRRLAEELLEPRAVWNVAEAAPMPAPRPKPEKKAIPLREQVNGFMKAVEEVYGVPCRAEGITSAFLHLTDFQQSDFSVMFFIDKTKEEISEVLNQTGHPVSKHPMFYHNGVMYGAERLDGSKYPFFLLPRQDKAGLHPFGIETPYDGNDFEITPKVAQRIKMKCLGIDTKAKVDDWDIIKKAIARLEGYGLGKWSISAKADVSKWWADANEKFNTTAGTKKKYFTFRA